MMEILRVNDVLLKLSVGMSTLYRYMRAGKFPRPYKLADGKTIVWSVKEFDAWHKRYDYRSGQQLREQLMSPRKPHSRQDLSGLRFNYWMVEQFAFAVGGHAYFLSRCRCGRYRCVMGTCLKNGHSKSCGCRPRKKSKRVALSRHPLYESWKQMRQRCTNVNSINFPNYGGRGIRVCARWARSFKLFLKDMGEKPGPEYTLDRIDVNGNYTPENCRWATPEQQRFNKRNTRRHNRWRAQEYHAA